MHRSAPEIIFEDAELVVINKPGGMLTLPDRHDGELQSLRGWLQHKYGNIFVVHRLDRETSGVMVFAKTESTHKYLSKLFEGREVEKTYLGLVMGSPLNQSGSIEEPIAEHPAQNGTMVVHKKGKASHTDYKVLHSYSKYSLLEFDLHTGRTHQIRVHCKHIGHPIACDPVYGDGQPVLLSSIKKKFKLSRHDDAEKPILSRLALHAHRLSFVHPSGEKLVFEAPLHKDMRALIAQLEKQAG